MKQAILTPVIVDGKIVRVTIDDPGRGYKVVPTVEITGNFETASKYYFDIKQCRCSYILQQWIPR